MPIEIRELVIKVTVDNQQAEPGGDSKDIHELKNKIVKECMEKILKKLNILSER
jgi:hypothetical protein